MAGKVCGQVNNLPTIPIQKEYVVVIPSHLSQVATFYFTGSSFLPLKTQKNTLIIKANQVGVQRLIAVVNQEIVWTKYYQVIGQTDKQVLFVNTDNFVIMPIDIIERNIPTYETDNGKIVPASVRNAFIISPFHTGKCAIIAKIKGKIVWKDEFEARKILPPYLFLANAQGIPVNIDNALPAQFSYRIAVQDDPIFQENPASYGHGYRIIGISYVLYRYNKAIKESFSADGSIQSPQSMGARVGDKIVIKVEEIQRICPTCCFEQIKILPNEFSFLVK